MARKEDFWKNMLSQSDMQRVYNSGGAEKNYLSKDKRYKYLKGEYN